MREDGTMMRTTELMELAKKWDIKFITIAALQEYRKIHEKLVDRVTEYIQSVSQEMYSAHSAATVDSSLRRP